ncbi:GNAT family N-acetyltransferase [Cryptosporangium sp. NPDC048952]|uniref:GNAT family N-acetyltransferase n=1 Tax=Cryptosporangium sp. NPDC048952 TaxID=3363961 RepID=UPI0037223F15
MTAVAVEPALHVREAAAADLAAVNDLHRRCSVRTLCSRYHAGRDRLTAAEWERMVDPVLGHTLLLADPDGLLVGFANVVRVSDSTAEVSLLLHDDWQDAGVGRAMSWRLVSYARRLGFADIVAWVEPDNRRAVSLLRGAGALPDFREPGEIRWALRL